VTRDEALRLLNLGPTASTSEIDAAILREYRLWNSRTNAPNPDDREAAQRRLRAIAEAETILLGPRQDRGNVPPPRTAGTAPPPPDPNTRRNPPPTNSWNPGTYPPQPSDPYQYNQQYPTSGTYGGAFRQATSGKAIAAFVLSLLWIFWIGTIIGLILAIVSLSEISKSGGRLGGKGLAIAALVLSGIGILTLLASLGAAGGGG